MANISATAPRSSITQGKALAMAVEWLNRDEVAAAIDCSIVGEVAMILARMADAKNKKPSNTDPDGFTKARRDADKQVQAVYDYMVSIAESAPEPTEQYPITGVVTSKELYSKVLGEGSSTQQAVIICRWLIAEGKVENIKNGSKTYYRAII